MMSFTSETWERSRCIRESIDTLPFVRGLGDGSLDRDTFTYYMAQDALYLADYGRVLGGLAAQASDPDELVFWAGCARDTILVERELHASHVGLCASTVPSPTCRAYTAYLLSLLSSGSYAMAAAGVLPCFWIYADVGDRLLAAAGDLQAHPYGDWIGMYADEAFAGQVVIAKSIVDRSASTASADEVERMHVAFATAARYEWMFWDAAWRRETWPV